MNPPISEIFLQGAEVVASRQYHQPLCHQQQLVDLSVDAPTCFDVLNGRGQGVQRHPGNVKYRALVFLNKGLYAKCPRCDKIKISKGIVAAIRALGGRFFELDEPSGTYYDIGDKKAWEKTSQALREGQKKIRQKIHTETASDNFDTSLLVSSANRNPSRPISPEEYSEYSVRALKSLCKSDKGDASQTSPRGEDLILKTSHRRQISSSPSLDCENSYDAKRAAILTPLLPKIDSSSTRRADGNTLYGYSEENRRHMGCSGVVSWAEV